MRTLGIQLDISLIVLVGVIRAHTSAKNARVKVKNTHVSVFPRPAIHSAL